MTHTEEEKYQISELANGILTAFDWDLTEEGTDYWRAVYDKLISIADEGKWTKI